MFKVYYITLLRPVHWDFGGQRKRVLTTLVKDYNMSMFKAQVMKVVRQIPYGRVVSYGQVAVYAGKPGAARAVGWILKQNETADIPWHRVINNQGRISIKGNWFHDAQMQAGLLRKEGIVINKDFTLDIEKYRWLQTNLQHLPCPECRVER